MRARVLYFFLVTAMLHQTTAIRCRAQVAAQPVESAAANSSVVPQAMRFSGAAANRAGDTLEAVFHIYAEPEGGEPLWSETQRITIERDGNYSVLLGAATGGGLPQSLFVGGKPRWLGISMERAPESPRVALVSVAYAMKAADAETLTGMPASEFVTQAQLRSSAAEAASAALAKAGAAKGPKSAIPGVTPTGSGTANVVPVWKTSSTLGNSILTQEGTTNGIITLFVNGNLNAANITGKSVATTTLLPTTGTAAIRGQETATSGLVYGVNGFADSSTSGAAGVNGIEGSSTGAVFGVSGSAQSKTAGAAGVSGIENSKTGQVFGVTGTSSSTTTLSAGVYGFEGAATGQVYGVGGITKSTTSQSAGVGGEEEAMTGMVYGVGGIAVSTTNGAAGVSGLENA